MLAVADRRRGDGQSGYGAPGEPCLERWLGCRTWFFFASEAGQGAIKRRASQFQRQLGTARFGIEQYDVGRGKSRLDDPYQLLRVEVGQFLVQQQKMAAAARFKLA